MPRFPGRRMRPAPQTDIQTRLRYISDECDTLKRQMELPNATVSPADLARLAYLVGYVAIIVEKHFKDDEK